MFATATKKINVFVLLVMMVYTSSTISMERFTHFLQGTKAAVTPSVETQVKLLWLQAQVVPVLVAAGVGVGSFFLAKSEKIDDKKVLTGLVALPFFAGRLARNLANKWNPYAVFEQYNNEKAELDNNDDYQAMQKNDYSAPNYYNGIIRGNKPTVITESLTHVDMLEDRINSHHRKEVWLDSYEFFNNKNKEKGTVNNKSGIDCVDQRKKIAAARFALRTQLDAIDQNRITLKHEKQNAWGSTVFRPMLPVIAASINFGAALLMNFPFITKLMAGK